MRRNRIAALAVLAALSALSAFGGDPVEAEHDPFPMLEALRPNVDFWARVFAEWTRSQVAIHDLEYPAIVYEVVELPGPIGESYSEEQKRWLEALREDWEDYLHGLEQRVADRKPLDEIDKQWALYFATVVGGDKLVGAHKRVRSQRGLRERFRAGLERSFRLDGVIREIMRAHDLPEDLAYLPHVESSFQYKARSTAGAAGLWQFTRGTGKRYLTITAAIDERLDPIAATRGAALYLKDAFAKLDTWPLALTSYNHGVQGMTRAMQRFGTDFEKIVREYDGRLFGFASKNFYAEFLAARRIASDPDTYFPEGYTPEPARDLESVVLDSRVTPYWVANRYGVTLDALASLNPGWSHRAVKNALKLPAGTEVWLPKGTLGSAAESGASGTAGTRRASSGAGLHYVVRRGDTLSGIAARYGIGLDRLRALNDMPRGGSLIRAGQRLRVGNAPAGAVHVVQPGETLSGIAQAYDISLRELRRHNDLAPHEDSIRPGQRLRVRDKAPAATVHVVQAGDTLSEIARAYGVPLRDLRSYNGLAPRESVIHAGQKLQLANDAVAASGRRHVVRRGDTLLAIASRYGVRLIDLLAENTLTMKATIHPGQTLRIP